MGLLQLLEALHMGRIIIFVRLLVSSFGTSTLRLPRSTEVAPRLLFPQRGR